MKNWNVSRWKIRIGDRNHNTSVDDANLKILDIQNFSVHPDYNQVTVYHDIAVLQTKPLNFNRGIQPVCLPR
jgi:hypothetical protein